jgi:cytochrome c553
MSKTDSLSLLLALGLLLTCHNTPAAETMSQPIVQNISADVENGKRIYLTGKLPSGDAIQATVQGDVRLTGIQATCAGCHGRSGWGSSEGSEQSLPIIGEVLYQPRVIQRKELYASRTSGPGTRPAYTDETLARAIRTGIDPAGRKLDPLMPRFDLSDRDIADVMAYLKSLSADSPGVTPSVVHFATVVSDEVPEVQRQAMLGVLQAFIDTKNAQTRHETKRAEYSPWHKDWKYQAYRQWQLHVWELHGTDSSWATQLETYYRNQSVFALISGVASGPWQPVHEFCRQFEVPCVLPNTDRPVVKENDFYTIYFSQGLALEARILARHFQENGINRVIQVCRGHGSGKLAADSLHQALQNVPNIEIRDITLADTALSVQRFWQDQVPPASAVLVSWLIADDISRLNALTVSEKSFDSIYLSSTLVGDSRLALPENLRRKILFVRPFALPADLAKRIPNIATWMRMKNIQLIDGRLQTNTYFAARVVGEALMHITNHFSRDYFIEKIEHHVTIGMVSPSFYPSVSLAPGQRFASKGGYIVRPATDAVGGLQVVGDLIVP